MANNTARTIDGMRPAGSRPRRVVSAGAVPRKAPLKKSENFGLTRDTNAELAKAKAKEDFLKPVSTLDFDLSSKDLKPDYSLKKRDVAAAPGKHKKSRNVKKKRTGLKVLITIFVILALGVGAFAIWGNTLIAKLTSGRSGLFDFIGSISSNVKLKTDKNGRTNVLIYGTSGFDMEGTDGDYAHDGAMLTDSIMVLSVDQETKDLAMISLPRDLYVGKTCTSTGKINEVYWCADIDGTDEEAGAEALATTITDVLGLEIQYWVHVDWGALMDVVDGIGGITVVLDEDINDDWTGIHINAGEPANLDGYHTVALARARHGTEMGDFSRGNSQQKILIAIQNKIVNEGIDFGQALNLIDAIGDNVRMNFSVDEIKTILSLAKDFALENMRQVPLVDYENEIYYVTTDEMNGISYVVPQAGITNYTAIQKYVAKMFSSNPAVREDAEIVVLNGSGETGAASQEKVKLTNDGYQNVTVEDAPDGEYNENYYVYHISGNAPGTAEALADKYETVALTAEQLPEGIDTDGVDIVVIVGKVPE